MRILALDLGKFKTVACMFCDDGGEQTEFETVETSPPKMAELIRRCQAEVVVFETCTAAGWLADLCEETGQEFLVANPSGEAWKWSVIKRKTDRDDAFKLARLTRLGELPTVHVPPRKIRARRSLLRFRQSLITRRVAVQNEIRALWQAQGLAPLPAGKCGWTLACRETLREASRSILECEPEELWRGQLALLLDELERAFAREKELESKLDSLAKSDANVQRLMTIPGVGRKTAEVICATLDDPHRFQNGRQVSSYAGLVPVQYQSGQSDRRGRITKRGSRLLRRTLVECGWVLIRYNPWAAKLVQRLTNGQKTRRKQALVALARRLLVRCWAMLRDGTDWQPERNELKSSPTL